MRKFILPILFLHFAVAVNAATYYFSTSSGSDSRTATQAQSSSTPWKTISKLNSIMSTLKAGDQVLFKRGETFNGAITITVSGTSSQPITFGAYGSGNKPVITGFSTLSGWTQARANVWEASLAPANGKTSMVIMNNMQQAIGRYPNKNATNGGYLTINSHNGLTELTSSQLPSSPNWTGAEIAIRKNRWVIDRSKVVYHIGTTIGFESGSTNTITDKYGFFIQSHTNTLDQNGEWYYDNTRGKLQMYFSANNPTAYAVKGCVIDNLVTISFQNYITFSNLVFSGANSYAFNLTNCSNITIDACSLTFIGINGVQGLSSNYVTVSNSAINNVNNNGIYLYWNCSNALISKNTIKNIAIIPGMAQNSTGTHQGMMLRGNNNLIQYNTIDSTGSNGVHFEGDYSTVQYNSVNIFGFVVDDCGGIYTGQGLGDNTQYNSKTIANNIVLNGIGAIAGTDDSTYIATQGIYLDDNSNHVTVTGNTVANCGQAGIFNHNATYTNITNNTMYNNGKEQFLAVRSFNPISNVTLTGNIMFSKTTTQLVNRIESYYGSNNLPQLGTFNNNYYCRPIDNNYAFFDMYQVGSTYYTSYETLETWRAKFGLDANSKGAPATIPSFSYSGATGVNIYPNGGYNTNIWNVAKFSSTGDISTSWLSSKLDAGTLQVTANSYSSANNFYLTLPTDKSVTLGKSYLLTFSLQGGASGRPMNVYLRQQDAPNNDLTPRMMIPITTTRKEYQFGFTPTSTSRVSVELDIPQPNSATWVDNVILQEAVIKQTNPDDYIVFQYNNTTATKSFSLSGTYLDAKGATYTGNITLQPYTSLVLFKQTTTPAFTSSTDAKQAISVQGNLSSASAASFTNSSSADVTWQVDNQESTAAYYEVAKSSDGQNFTTIGKTSAKKNNESSVTYQYNDAQPLGGKNYYRITQFDEKGVPVINKTVMVNNISFKVNPNPVKDIAHIFFDKPVSAADHLGKDIVIRSTAGAVVKTIQLPSTDNLNKVDLNVSSLQRGMYIVSLTSEGKTFSSKFIKE